MTVQASPRAHPEKRMTLSSPMTTSSIRSQRPILTRSGLSNVDAISASSTRACDQGDIMSTSCERMKGQTKGTYQSLDALEVGVLNGHDLGVGEHLLGVVVDQLTADEAAVRVGSRRKTHDHEQPPRAAGQNTYLMLCLRIFCTLVFIFSRSAFSISPTLATESTLTRAPWICNRERAQWGNRAQTASRTNLDLVRVERSVGDEDARLLDALGLAHADLLVEDEAGLEVRVLQRAARLLDDLDVLQVRAALHTPQSEHTPRVPTDS